MILSGIERNHFADLAQRVFLSVYPDFCVMCAQAGSKLCLACSKNMIRMDENGCRLCGFPLGYVSAETICSACISCCPEFDVHSSLFVYDGVIRDLIHKFKYHGDFAVLGWIKQQIDDFFCEKAWFDMIVPVPLHSKKLKQRGFNQSLELARLVAKKVDKPCLASVLTRIIETSSQTNLNREQRQHNIKNAFRVLRPDAVASKKILIVDDVFTTGATLNALAKALKNCGATTVSAFTLARGKL